LIRSLKQAARGPHVVAMAVSAARDAFCEFSINTFESFNSLPVFWKCSVSEWTSSFQTNVEKKLKMIWLSVWIPSAENETKSYF